MGNKIPDTDHVSHYCRPGTVAEGLPTIGSFLPRDNEEYLSANWLEYFGSNSEASVEMIRDTFIKKKFTIRKNGRFAVFNVGQIISAIAAVAPVSVEHLPVPNDLSHSGIVWNRSATIDFAVATKLNEIYIVAYEGVS